MVSAGYDSSVLSSRDDGRDTDPDTGMLSIGAREVVPDLCCKCEPAVRRILNRALFTHITIDDEENAPDTPDETTASVLAHTTIDAPAHVTAETKLPRHQAGQFSIFSSYVGLSERCGNRRRVVERLIAAWKRGVGEVRSPVDPIVFAESEAVTEPRRRFRTPLTEQEVDAMRTARSNGVSVSTVAKQFTVHRGTVWAKTHY